MSNDNSQFSAANSALGYLYQVRSALLWSLGRLRSHNEFLVSIETLDDVLFESKANSPIDLIQTKHHVNRSAELTDYSVDLWKTLRIWFEGSSSGTIPSTAFLHLVTTGCSPENSAASRLRTRDRDVEVAQNALTSIAQTSTNKTNAAGYAAYLAVSAPERIAVLDRITVLDNAPSVGDLDAQLRSEVYWAAEKEHHTAFLDRLEGWWLRRVLVQLINQQKDRVSSDEIEAQMADLREQFKQDSLPIDDDILTFVLDETLASTYNNFVFVKQLDLINVGKRRIAAAIRDYYRAFEQRSRWLRDDLLSELDLGKYEQRLEEEWELVFEAMRDELGDEVTNEVMMKAARSVLEWAESACIPIRPRVTEPFVTRGSLHILADDGRIGWHSSFRDHLSALLRSRVEPV
jgi:hypothetical protein